MLVNIGPILIALGAAVFLREGISKWLAIGTGVAFFGVLLIWTSSGGVGLGDGGGVLWCLLAAISYAGGVLMQKPALRRLPARQVTWMGCVIGMIACLPFGGQLLADVQNAPAISVAGAIYLGAVPTALAFSTWAYALSKLPAAQLGVSTYVVPPLAILLGFLVFGEVPTVVAAIGGGVCLVGVALSRRRMRGSA
jgi:drug/metabolite transporter (DMT)-like permease